MSIPEPSPVELSVALEVLGEVTVMAMMFSRLYKVLTGSGGNTVAPAESAATPQHSYH